MGRSRCYDRCAGWSSLVARWAHNPKVGGSNPPPATKPPVWFQWVEPISQTDSTTLNPDSQPIFQILFTQRFTQNVVGHSVSSRRPTLCRANPLPVRASRSTPIRSPFPRHGITCLEAPAQLAQPRAHAAEVRFRRPQQLSGSGRRRGHRNRSHDWENTRILSP